MLSLDEARVYDQELHPAFAGYLFDGSVSQRDVLATVFHLLTIGVLTPVWEDGKMTKNIIAVRKTRKSTGLAFDRAFEEALFGMNNELTAKEIGSRIRSGEFAHLIENNLQAIAAFPIINEHLKFSLGKNSNVTFSVNGEPVTTLKDAQNLRKLLRWIFLPVFAGVGGLLFILAYFLNGVAPGQENYTYQNGPFSMQFEGGSSGFLLTGAVFILVIGLIYAAFAFSRKTVSYDFKNNVEPIAKKKYRELFEFLKTHPLPKHRFTNEFLAFSIAFGLDDTWHKDFGLEKEIHVDESPLT